MARRRVAAIALLLVVTGCTGGAEPITPPTSSMTSSAHGGGGVLDRLLDGGLTIVIRHAATDQSRPDQSTVDLNDCATQRNLSEEGRADARTIGEAVRRLEVPVGDVWSSPYCRSRDTAELAFGRAEVVPGLERLYPERDQQADRRLNQRIREHAPRVGEPNLVIVSHGVYPSVLTPGAAIGEGEAALYSRTGTGFALLDRITPDEWAGLRSEVDGLTAGAARVPDSVVRLDGPGGTGSAFRVAVPGILVTSARLVADAREVTVVRPDGIRLTARVLGRRPDVDIAALRVDDSGLPPLHSGSGLSQARTGNRVFAIGASGAVTAGSIRALADTIRIDSEVPEASVGGPLVNEDGYVLGVLAAGNTAIPVDIARNAALDIVHTS